MFVEAYIASGMNASEAMRKLGCPESTAGSRGCEFLRHKDVQDMIKKRQEETLAELKLTADEVLASLTRAIRFDPRLLFTAEGKLKKITELPDEVALELEDFEVSMKRGIKVGFPKKHGAREQAMRYFGMFAKDKQGARPDDDGEPPPVAITIDFKDARRKK